MIFIFKNPIPCNNPVMNEATVFEKINKTIAHPYAKLLIFFTSFVWFLSFSGAVLPAHFLENGLTFPQISFGTVLSMLGQILSVIAISKINAKSKSLWVSSLVLYIIIFSLYVVYPSVNIYFIASFLSGIASIFFYATYNVSHFTLTPDEKTGISAAIFFNILSVVGIISPLISGTVAHFSIYYLLFLSIIFTLLPLYLLKFQQNMEIKYSILGAIREIRNVRLPMFLHGSHEALGYGIIPIFTLSLVGDPLRFGVFNTLIKLLTVCLSLFIGFKSDKMKNKKALLSVVILIVSFITFLYSVQAITTQIYLWSMLNIALGVVSPIYNHVSLSFVIDSTKSKVDAIFGRELMINIGRFSGMIVVYLGFLYKDFLPFSIYILGTIALLYALVVYKTKTTQQS